MNNLSDILSTPMDIEDIDSVGVEKDLPIQFSDTIRNMTVGELLQQVKGTNQDLYNELQSFLKDVYHEEPEHSSCGCGDDIYGMPDITTDLGDMPSIKKVIVMRSESTENIVQDRNTLLIEAYKIKKQLNGKR